MQPLVQTVELRDSMLPFRFIACGGLVAGLALGCGEEDKPVDQVHARMEEETRELLTEKHMYSSLMEQVRLELESAADVLKEK